MKKVMRKFIKSLASIAVAMAWCGMVSAQGLPPQGPPVGQWGPPSGMWGSPWTPGWNYAPVAGSPMMGVPSDSGVTKVIACGYDAQGVWRVIPLTVSYQYDGVQYQVTVLNAWNPWTDMWDRGVDDQAFITNYVLRGTTFNYYVVLSTGTYYFNL